MEVNASIPEPNEVIGQRLNEFCTARCNLERGPMGDAGLVENRRRLTKMVLPSVKGLLNNWIQIDFDMIGSTGRQIQCDSCTLWHHCTY